MIKSHINKALFLVCACMSSVGPFLNRKGFGLTHVITTAVHIIVICKQLSQQICQHAKPSSCHLVCSSHNSPTASHEEYHYRLATEMTTDGHIDWCTRNQDKSEFAQIVPDSLSCKRVEFGAETIGFAWLSEFDHCTDLLNQH